ncbi:hypothetical protein BDQ17DRAFT_1394613 [Cyathus striatus]|nr:hypothetical protein BDQ17DRAFT_1394613 [Cyathus striatus]
MISCAAEFPLELFEAALLQIIHHPEYNSTLILRSSGSNFTRFPEDVPCIDGLQIVRCIRRRLLPRRPGRDRSLEQFCTFYAAEGEVRVVCLRLLWRKRGVAILPPSVSHIAFHYLSPSPSSPSLLRIETIPLQNTPTDPSSRLARTLYRSSTRCVGAEERYQDLYVVLRERWVLVGVWREVTDPRKHDIGIATYLMLLWKDASQYDYTEGKTPWRAWPRPPGGFLDLGEGYEVYGIDLRARSSWEGYSEKSQARLKVVAVYSTVIPSTYHELTLWTPLFTVLYGCAGYISIPYCPWSFDAKYDRAQMEDAQREKEEEELGLTGPGKKSAYATYRLWLARLSAYCGWLVEANTLRVPSTRNWGVVGRRRGKVPPEEALENVLGIIRNVNE